MATAKKNTSASSHQRDLARMSGNTAAKKKGAEDRAKYGRSTLDSTGSAAVRAERKALKSFGLKTEPGKTTKSRQAAPAKPSTIQQIANRFGVTAREARDIAKAIGNVAESAIASKNLKNKSQQYYGGQALKASVKDLKKQVKETGKAATTGKKGTRTGTLKYDVDTGAPFGLNKGNKKKFYIQ